MFVNFTNHPSGSWSAAQRRAAQVYGEILAGLSRHTMMPPASVGGRNFCVDRIISL